MTGRGAGLLAITLVTLVCGLSLGGQAFYLFALFGALMLLFSLLSLLIVRARVRVESALSPRQALRGEASQLQISARGGTLLPASPLALRVSVGGGEARLALPLPMRGNAETTLRVSARHVGMLPAGVTRAEIGDALGLFRARVRVSDPPALLCLPRDFEVAPLRFLSAEEGRGQLTRAAEDLSSPEDTRAYRQGDPLKRVHWKLSARRRELIVRRFETPAPPDTLVLADCSAPGDAQTGEEERAALRDALCETALSVALLQIRAGAPVRVPLYGAQMTQFVSEPHGNADALARLLAAQPFAGGTPFSAVLEMEARRLRRTGATVLITTRLDAALVEGARSLRRMGPSVRLYYVTHTPDAEGDRPFIAQLQQSLVEVCYVRPG